MKRLATGLALAAFAAVPSVASADPASQADKGEAAKECRQFLDAAGNRANLGRIFGTDRANAVRECRSEQTRDAHNERHRSARQAVENCKANPVEGQTLGECVSAERRRLHAEADRRDRERIAAVRECQENSETGRAFGRCVAKAQSNENAADGQAKADEGAADGGAAAEQGAANAEQGTTTAGQGAANGEQGTTAAEQGQAYRPDGVPPTPPDGVPPTPPRP